MYTIYHEGRPLGIITRGAYQVLADAGLLKKQQTVELVDDYQAEARKKGIKVQQFRNRDGTQTLIKVEVAE